MDLCLWVAIQWSRYRWGSYNFRADIEAINVTDTVELRKW